MLTILCARPVAQIDGVWRSEIVRDQGVIKGYMRQRLARDADEEEEPENLAFNGDPVHDAAVRKKWVSVLESHQGVSALLAKKQKKTSAVLALNHHQAGRTAGQAAQEPGKAVAEEERKDGRHRRRLPARRQEGQERDDGELRYFG